MLEYQLIKSVHTCVTTPLQYKQHMLRIISYKSDITIKELAAKINKNTDWIYKTLQLFLLHDSVYSEVTNGAINLTNAYVLCKLPKLHQLAFVEMAKTFKPLEFVLVIHSKIQELRNK